MKVFGIILCLLAVEGFMVKHLAFILLHGSIFEPLRWGINRRMRWNYGFRRWFFKKLSELFSCNLCMTAQVSLWFHGLLFVFLFIFFLDRITNLVGFLNALPLYADIIVLFFAWFFWSIVIAASGMLVWELTGIPIARAHELERHKKKMEDIKTRQVASENGWKLAKNNNLPITFLDFFFMISVVECDILGTGCRGLRGILRGEGIEDICQQWAADKRIAWEKVQMEILPLVQKAAKLYFAGLKGAPASRMQLLHNSWNKAQDDVVI